MLKDTEKFYHSLFKLNPYEAMGKEYFQHCGCELNVEQYGYLLRHPFSRDWLHDLSTPAALQEQQELKDALHQDHSLHGLSAEMFFPEGKQIEIQRLQRFIHIPQHKHDFVEMVYVLSGVCLHVIGEDQYENHPGDFTIIPPSVKHELHASEDCICLTMKLRSKTFVELVSGIFLENSLLSPYFHQALNDSYYRCVMVLHSKGDDYLRDTALRMYIQQEKALMYADGIIAELMKVFLSYMLQNYQETFSLLVSNAVEHEEMVQILGFIYDHYQAITLQEVAEQFHVSVPYLSTKIHKLTGRTFSEHLRSYRLKQAAELLRSTDMKVDLVCEQIGYQDTAQFIRSFKSVYGMTPL